MVTTVPTVPVTGSIEVMTGRFTVITVKGFPADVPTDVVTVTVVTPLARPEGTVHLMLVFDQEEIAASVLPNITLEEESRVPK